MTMKQAANDIYEIKKDGSDIFLSMTIGHQQTGDIEIYLNGTKRHQGTGSINLKLAKDKDLMLADLKVIGFIQDISNTFNHVSMTATLLGGKTVKSWTVGTESKNGVTYELRFGVVFID